MGKHIVTGKIFTGLPPLTDGQRAVVDQPPEAMVLVTAGAGTGKTHTLVSRIERLLSDEGVLAGDVLVLTYSRAAVRQLRERLSAHGGRGRYVRVTTFDSWALEVLEEVAADIDWRARPFDERIREATARLADARAAPEWLDELRHVVIDEVQDLVGDRRELIEVLLESYDCGFTVVGDPAQAIYGYQVTAPEERAIETNRFFDWLRSYFRDELVELTLDHNFRACTVETRTALTFAEGLRNCTTKTDAEHLHEELRKELAARMEFGDLTVPFIRDSLLDTEIRTAVLCRTNGEALLISEWFHGAGVPHQLRRAAEDRAAPAWLTDLMHADPDALYLSRPRYEQVVSVRPDALGGTDIERQWHALIDCAGDRSGRSIDLSRLYDVLAAGRLPDQLTAQSPHPLVISTFHRAKGLEFDRVLVSDPGPLEPDDGSLATDLADAARALYVAMTRAREELYRLEPPNDARVEGNGFRFVRRDRSTGRWARFGYQAWKRAGMEMIGGDIDRRYSGGRHWPADEAGSVQQLLRTSVLPGERVELVRIDDEPANHDSRMAPGYALLREQRCIGFVSEQFRRALYVHLQQSRTFRPRNWPGRVTGLRLETVESVAGEQADARRAALGGRGVWLVPRPIGIGRFHYDNQNKD
ncbi:UvrD-helicase domain-containing protein [Streptomyces harbinensis]|uniref:UvrD-helicase domain-containing protein n=1 Tax=Streptomyces harbinensis TaxID=1176198 RepID=UPI0036BDC4F3